MTTKARIDIIGRDKTKAAFRSAEGSLKRFKSAALGVGAVLTTGLFARATKGAIDFADSIDKASKAAGVGAEFLQEMRFAGDQLGVSQKQVDEGFRRFTRRLGKFAVDGGGPAANAIKSLGIEVTDVQGKFRGSEAIFKDFVSEIQQFESFAKKSAIAAEIFGDDAGPKLALLLDQGSAGINRLSQEAHDIGAVMSEDVIENAVEAKDALAKLTNVLGVQLSTALVELAPILTAAAEGFVNLARTARLAFSDINNLSADLLIRKLENLESLREDVVKRLKGAEAAAGDNSFLGTMNNLFSRDVDDFKLKIAEIDEERAKAELALGKINFEAAFGGGEGGRKRQVKTDNLIDLDGIDKDVKTIQSRLNPLQAAAIKFNRELESIKKSDLGGPEKAELIRKLQQEFSNATGSVKTLKESAGSDFDALKDRLFPLQAAAKKFNQELKLIRQSELSTAEQEEATRRLEEGFAKATGGNKELQAANKELGKGAIDMGFAFTSAFEDAVLGGEAFSDVLDGLLKDLQKVALRQLITAPAGNALSAGISRTFPGFASGGSFTVGGSGGTDSQLVAFNATPGERVAVSTPGNQVGSTTVNVINNSNAQAEVTRSNDGSGKELINVIIGQVAQSISSGGQVAQAMQGVFGVRRQGILRT